MKLSSILRSPWRVWNLLVKMFDHAETASAIMGAFMGAAPTANESIIARGVYGIFGYQDEIELRRALDALTDQGIAEAIVGFWRWQFPVATPAQRAVAWWYGNKLRVYVTKNRSLVEQKALLGGWGIIIISTPGGREAGYRALRADLLSGVADAPLPPDGMLERVERLYAAAPDAAQGVRREARRVNVGLRMEARRLRRENRARDKRSWLRRLFQD